MIMMPRKNVMLTRIRTWCWLLIVLTVSCGMLLAPHMTSPVMAQSDSPKPIAVIDGTFNVYVGTDVYLTGTLSKDPGGNALSYQWTLVSSPVGSIAMIGDSSSAQASFRGDVVGTYMVRLVVNNASVDSDPACATVMVTTHPYMW